MIKNGIKRLWAEGKPVLNGWLSIPNAFTAEIMAGQGYDSITIDTQHGMIGFEPMLGMLQAMRFSPATLLVRVPWLDPAPIMQALDAGAYGVICPMINSRAEAERLVSYVRYPPKGERSFGPTRANYTAGPGYAAEANDEILCFAMVETAESVANLAEIVATPGLDGIYIGPADLSFSLSEGRLTPGFDRQETEMIAVIRSVVDAAHAHGKRAGLHNGTADYAAEAAQWGVDLLTVSSDARLMAEAASASITWFRALRASRDCLGASPKDAKQTGSTTY